MVTLAAVGNEVSLGRSTRDAPLPTPANLSDATVLADGSVVAVTQRQSAEGWALYQQRFSADGAPLDPEPVRVAKSGALGSPEVVALDGGGFVIAWTETAPDRMIGGAGNDVMDGGTGLDRFVFDLNFGQDRITGFDANANNGQDLLDIAFLGITADTFSSLVTVAQSGGDTLVTIGADTIRLIGVSAATVNQSDFILAP